MDKKRDLTGLASSGTHILQEQEQNDKSLIINDETQKYI